MPLRLAATVDIAKRRALVSDDVKEGRSQNFKDESQRVLAAKLSPASRDGVKRQDKGKMYTID
jgi:hypothetical protein